MPRVGQVTQGMDGEEKGKSPPKGRRGGGAGKLQEKKNTRGRKKEVGSPEGLGGETKKKKKTKQKEEHEGEGRPGEQAKKQEYGTDGGEKSGFLPKKRKKSRGKVGGGTNGGPL